MQFNIFLVAAIFSDLALATYEVRLYKSGKCSGVAGLKCPGLAAGKCCSRKSNDAKKGIPPPWSLWQSSDYVETGSKKANGNDQVKIYTLAGDDPCGMPSDQSPKCASSTKSITGAAVFVVVPTGSGRSSRHSKFRREAQPAMEAVEPSEFFYKEGKTEYSLPIKSARGQELENIKSEADQLEHVKKYGKRSVLLE